MIIQQLLWIYCRVRFAQYFLQFIGNVLVPDHDAQVFNPPGWTDDEKTLINVLFSGFRRWDAVHFLHIARFGYTYENLLAFFPAYPILIVRPFGRLFSLIFNEADAFLFAGVWTNFLLGFVNCLLIYFLALKFRLKPQHAFCSSIIFIVNPATVFFLAPYSECSFLFSQLLGHFFLESHQLFFATISFAFGSSVRSNGIVSLGFLIYYSFQTMYRQRRFYLPLHNFLLCLTPFVLVEIFHYKTFCFEQKISKNFVFYGEQNQLKMPLSNFSSIWCEKSIPFSYSYVQNRYWNVGFLRYWQWKQIPNFLLATPIFLIVSRIFRLWFVSTNFSTIFDEIFGDDRRHSTIFWLKNKRFLPHLFYSGFLCLFALGFMHIQVSTRFLFSSGPFLYYICSEQMKTMPRNLKEIFIELRRNSFFIFFFCFFYIFVGICFFANFLPWT